MGRRYKEAMLLQQRVDGVGSSLVINQLFTSTHLAKSKFNFHYLFVLLNLQKI